jgi:hypothetical protein
MYLCIHNKSASRNRRPVVRIFPIVVAELKLRDIEWHLALILWECACGANRGLPLWLDRPGAFA